MSLAPCKSGNICFWFITFVFLLLIVAGGAILVIYITFPETEGSGWLAVAGIVLIGVPWLFWIMACLYRAFFSCQKLGAVVPLSTGVEIKSGDVGAS
ncbi:uncharacterized protein LOC110022229 [Phalaenopsis equestris]|uniref:uncharacterized protein LOC110022229 n=1 Tax=Phalaenopsis equestris TaxID=78828 RepID=UPI0009E1F3F6|nr:uncharacterized protein LOC110022229 [Phalaenopsis equestris]